jgi:hypothetical protein
LERIIPLNKNVANLNIFDEVQQLKIQIAGRFAGEVVHRVKELWTSVLNEGSGRQFTVDISSIGGYDVAGGKLLRELYHHGTHISARNPRALAFLSEISAPERPGLALVYQSPKLALKPASNVVSPFEQRRRAVAGD